MKERQPFLRKDIVPGMMFLSTGTDRPNAIFFVVSVTRSPHNRLTISYLVSRPHHSPYFTDRYGPDDSMAWSAEDVLTPPELFHSSSSTSDDVSTSFRADSSSR